MGLLDARRAGLLFVRRGSDAAALVLLRREEEEGMARVAVGGCRCRLLGRW